VLKIKDSKLENKTLISRKLGALRSTEHVYIQLCTCTARGPGPASPLHYLFTF